MTMNINNTQMRGDFRCSLCRQKQAFHCEHDTPYRDQYLGTFDPTEPRENLINNRRSKSETRLHNNSTSNGGLNAGRRGNSNLSGQNHQGKKLNNTTNNNHKNAGSSKKEEENPKSKSCVIL